jgi:NAD(P)-dependent dehydrogenase (short-subunit alcohol dehydrogenase family)
VYPINARQLAAAVAFAQHGAKVAVSGRHPEQAEALLSDLKGAGAEATTFVRADIRHEDEVSKLVGTVTGQFGRLDIAVNNAGSDGQMGNVADVTPEAYAGTFDTNVLGTLLAMKHELRVMQEQRSGAIVNLSSIYGVKGFPGAALYVASKHAIIGLTKSAALEGAPLGIRVNAVAPGPVQTDMLERVTGRDAQAKAAFLAQVPQGRAGDVAEIAEAIVFITSEQAGFLTGQTIFLDGGMMAA